jgi:hypothetical protein
LDLVVESGQLKLSMKDKNGKAKAKLAGASLAISKPSFGHEAQTLYKHSK